MGIVSVIFWVFQLLSWRLSWSCFEYGNGLLAGDKPGLLTQTLICFSFLEDWMLVHSMILFGSKWKWRTLLDEVSNNIFKQLGIWDAPKDTFMLPLISILKVWKIVIKLILNVDWVLILSAGATKDLVDVNHVFAIFFVPLSRGLHLRRYLYGAEFAFLRQSQGKIPYNALSCCKHK